MGRTDPALGSPWQAPGQGGGRQRHRALGAPPLHADPTGSHFLRSSATLSWCAAGKGWPVDRRSLEAKLTLCSQPGTGAKGPADSRHPCLLATSRTKSQPPHRPGAAQKPQHLLGHGGLGQPGSLRLRVRGLENMWFQQGDAGTAQGRALNIPVPESFAGSARRPGMRVESLVIPPDLEMGQEPPGESKGRLRYSNRGLGNNQAPTHSQCRIIMAQSRGDYTAWERPDQEHVLGGLHECDAPGDDTSTPGRAVPRAELSSLLGDEPL